MIGGKKVEADHGIAVGGGVEDSVLINGNVSLHFSLTQAAAEAKTLQAHGEPRRLDWESTEARYDTWGVFGVGSRAQEQPTHAALVDWLKDDSAPPVFALLGEYGMGKTLECQRLHCLLRDASMSPDSPTWMPRSIYFDLRKSPQFRDAERRGTMSMPSARAMVEQLIERDWVTSEGARPPGYEDVKAWLTQGALLIVDGLDECMVHLVERQHGDFLSVWVDLVADAAKQARREGAGQPRLLVSCRTEFFRNLAHQRALFRAFEHAGDARTEYREFVLRPLSENQIYGFIHARCPDLDEAEVRALIETTHNLGELSRRPITLKLLVDQLPKLLAMRQRAGAVNAAGLYGLVVDDTLAMDEDGRHHLHPEHKRALLSALAAHLWRIGARTMSHAKLRDWLHVWLKALCQRDARAEHDYRDIRGERLEEDLRTATLIVRVASPAQKKDLDEEEAEGFAFAHSSFAEYFLAVYLADAVRDNRPDDWAMAIPSPETLDFLAQQLELEQAVLPAPRCRDGGLPATLTAWAKTCRPQVTELLLKYALHARGVKLRAPVLPNLCGADFSSARLRGWRIGERLQDAKVPWLDLSHTCWAGADLRECDFAYVHLDDGDFRGARLDLAAFQHCSAERCDWRDSDLLGTVFRHCRLDWSQWQPLRKCHRLKVVACSGAKVMTNTLGSPQVAVDIFGVGISVQSPAKSLASILPPPRLRAALACRVDGVRSVALSTDGSLVVSGLEGCTVRVWDACSGESVLNLRGHKSAIWSVALSTDGSRLVSGSEDGTVRVWDAVTGESISELRGHKGAVWSVAMSADGGRVVSGSEDCTVRVWDARTSESLRELRGHTRAVNSVALSADGSILVSGSDDSTVQVWDANTGKSVGELRRHKGAVWAVAMSADGARVVSGSEDGMVRVWNASCDESVRELCGHTDWVRSVALSADGGRAVSCSDDGTVRVWDTLLAECVCELRGHTGRLMCVALSADGGQMVSGSSDGAIRVWDACSGENVREIRGYTRAVSRVAMSADGNSLVSGSADGAVRLWDACSGKILRELHGHAGLILSVALSADGGQVASGSEDGTVRVWDAVSGKVVSELRGHRGAVLCVALNADGSRVASGSEDGTVRVWDAFNGESICELRGHSRTVKVIALSPDGDCVVSGSADGRVQVWDVSCGESVRVLHGDTSLVLSIALSVDCGRVVWCSEDGVVRMWAPSHVECVRELRIRDIRRVLSVALSADGSRVVSGSKNGTLRVWDACNGGNIRDLRDHADHVLSVAVSGDGGRVVSGSSDGTIRCFAGAGGRSTTIDDLQCVWMAAVGSPHGITSHASWRPGRDGESDTLISASGDAWRFLSWDMEDPSEPSGWKRVPLQGYE